MKHLLTTGILLVISLSCLAQKRDSAYTLWLESSVFDTRTTFQEFSSFLDGYSDLPSYLATYPNGRVFQKFYRDSLIDQSSYDDGVSANLDFRNKLIGIQKNIRTWSLVQVDHSVGISFSAADFTHYTIRYRELYDVLAYDSMGAEEKAVQHISRVNSFGRSRKIGLLYQNSGSLKLGTWFRLDAILRHNLRYKFRNDLYLQEVNVQDTIYGGYMFYGDGTPSGPSIFDNFTIASRKYPSSMATLHQGKRSFQYDAMGLLRPTFLIGQDRRLEVSIHIGTSFARYWGSEYSEGQEGFNYGFGLAHKI